jgi:hypothetical protein
VLGLRFQSNLRHLLVTTTKGRQHGALNAEVLAIQQLAVKNYFDVSLFEYPDRCTYKYLKQFKVDIFLNTIAIIF